MVGCSGLAGTDSPNWLVSKNNLAEIFSAEVEERFNDLSLDNIEISAVFAFFEHFADAEDWTEAVFQSQSHLVLQCSSCFAVVLTTFRVTKDYISSASRSHHSSRNFASVSTLCLVGAVFSAQTKLFADNSLNSSEMCERNANNDIALWSDSFESGIYFACQLYTFWHCSVHLPVASNNILSHCFSYN